MESKITSWMTFVVFAISLTACDSDSGSLLEAPSPGGSGSMFGFSVGGDVAGLASGASLELTEVTSGQVVTVVDGTYSFTGLEDSASYEITINEHPQGQYCEIEGAEGTITGADVAGVNITCKSGYDLRLSGFNIFDPNIVVAGIRVENLATQEPELDLNLSDFEAYENSLPIGQESFLAVEKVPQASFSTRAVLLLDTSSSIDEDEMRNLKTAAKSALRATSDGGSVGGRLFNHQEVAIYTFDSQIKQIAGFTGDVDALEAAIDTIQESVIGRNNSTNLFGAVETAIAQWDVVIDLVSVEYGYAVLLTDGVHSYDSRDASSVNLTDQFGVLRDIFAIAVGDEASVETLAELTGDSRRVYQAESFNDATELGAVFTKVTEEAYKNTLGWYRVYYASPKRAGTNSVAFNVKDNSEEVCPESESESCSTSVSANFSADSFGDSTPAVFALLSGGVEEPPGSVIIGASEILTVVADLRWVDVEPEFTFSVGGVVGDAPVAEPVNEKAVAYSFPDGFGSAEITVLERKTSATATVTVEKDVDGRIRAQSSSVLYPVVE